MWFSYPRIPRNAHFAQGTLAQPGAVKRRKSSPRKQGAESTPEPKPRPSVPASESTAAALSQASLSPNSSQRIRAVSPPSWDELTSDEESTATHPFGSLSLAARRIKLRPPSYDDEAIRLAMEAVAVATSELERQKEMPVVIPRSMTRREKEQLAKVEIAREKLRDGHMLTISEMWTLEAYEQRREAEAKAKRKMAKQMEELKKRVKESAGGPKSAKAAREAREREAMKEKEQAILAAQKAEEEAKRAEMEARRKDKEAELIKEAEADDAALIAELERRRAEAEAAEAARRAEEQRTREEAEAKAREDAIQAAKEAEAAAKIEELAAKHAAKANAPLIAQREREAAEAAEAEANKPKKKPGVPRLAGSRGTSSAGSSPANSHRTRDSSPAMSHRGSTASPPISARATPSPQISARGAKTSTRSAPASRDSSARGIRAGATREAPASHDR